LPNPPLAILPRFNKIPHLLQSDLPGFYDPSIGDDKILRIEYTYQNQFKVINIKDNEALRLPLPG